MTSCLSWIARCMYGSVRKKSRLSAEATAVVTAGQRPPNSAATITRARKQEREVRGGGQRRAPESVPRPASMPPAAQPRDRTADRRPHASRPPQLPGSRPKRSSRSRFSSSTLTRGSPRKPSVRGSVRGVDQRLDVGGGHAARGGHARHLPARGLRAHVRVEAAAGRRHELDRHRARRAGVLGLQALDVRRRRGRAASATSGRGSSPRTRPRRSRRRPRPTAAAGSTPGS